MSGLGSRSPTGRPKRVASQTHDVPDQASSGDPPPPEDPPAREPEGGGRSGRRTTVALLVAVVLLAAVLVAGVVRLARDDAPTVSAARPVVTGELAHRAAVDTAARSTEEILSTTFEDYDEQVDEAAAKMTEAFAEEYRGTAESIADRFVEQRTRLQVQVVGQSVVQASADQVRALLFLDQYVEKRVDGEPRTDLAQYRALVTVVRTDQGWLVSDIETQ